MKLNHRLAVPRLGFALGLGLLVSVAGGGCSGAAIRDDKAPSPLDLRGWCKEVNGKLCNSVARSCFKGMAGFAEGCLDSALPSCLAGRDPASSSGRHSTDLDRCLAAIEPLSCQELGLGLGSGKLAAVCGAIAPGGVPATEPAAPTAPATPPAH